MNIDDNEPNPADGPSGGPADGDQALPSGSDAEANAQAADPNATDARPWGPAPGADNPFWPSGQQSGWQAPTGPGFQNPQNPYWPPAQQPGWGTPSGPGPAPSWPPAQQPGFQSPQPSWPPAQQSGWGTPPGAGPAPSWPPAQQPGFQNPQPSWPPAQQPSWPPAQQSGWTPGPQPWQSLSNLYPEPSGRRRSRLPAIAGVVVAALIAFSLGMVVDRSVVVSAQPQTQTSGPLQGFSVYEEALRDIKSQYVGRASITDQQLLYGSIRGMVDALGDTNHTRFLTPQEFNDMTSQLNGSVAGIGVYLTTDSGAFVIDRVISGSPAEQAGILTGDEITAVNGKSVAGQTFDQLAAQVRGTPGTQVTLTILHAGSTVPVDITVTRATIKAPLVDWGMVPGTTVADITLFEFADGAGDQIKTAIDGATKAGATGIVLDLRGNPGGLASEARNVASEFLSTGTIYQEENSSGRRTSITVDTSWTATSLPMVVLVDHNTASAAEIVAGAVQDNLRGKIVGQTTVGTGTVLQPFVLSDGSAILLGVADWLTPSGHRIFGVGIQPDQTVALPVGGQPIDPIKLDKMTAATVNSSGDSQLLAALTLLGQTPH